MLFITYWNVHCSVKLKDKSCSIFLTWNQNKNRRLWKHLAKIENIFINQSTNNWLEMKAVRQKEILLSMRKSSICQNVFISVVYNRCGKMHIRVGNIWFANSVQQYDQFTPHILYVCFDIKINRVFSENYNKIVYDFKISSIDSIRVFNRFQYADAFWRKHLQQTTFTTMFSTLLNNYTIYIQIFSIITQHPLKMRLQLGKG